jgi:hypothetical protein
MRHLIPAILFFCLLMVCSSGCGPAYGNYYGGGFAPAWGGGFWGPAPVFAEHHSWEDHQFHHPSSFYHGSMEHFANAGHFGGLHGGGFHDGGGGHR